MNKKMLVVIDMVEGFVNFGNLADKNINRIVPKIVSLVERSLREGWTVVAFKDTHEKDDVEFENYPPHCVKGSKECELIPELKKFENQMVVIEKNTTDGFKTRRFKELLKFNDFDEIHVSGCCTDICVANFLKSLSNHLKINSQKTKIFVEADAVDTFNAPAHEADEINLNCLKSFKKDYGVQICLTSNTISSKKRSKNEKESNRTEKGL